MGEMTRSLVRERRSRYSGGEVGEVRKLASLVHCLKPSSVSGGSQRA